MGKINLMKIAVLFVSVFMLLSCSNDDSEASEDYGITTGDYFPLAENNKWWYLNNSEISLVYIGGINNFDNVPYYRVNDDSAEINIQHWMTKKGASYYQRIGEVLYPLEGGFTLEMGEYEIKLFKDDLPVGGTWSDSLPLSVRVHTGGGNPQSLPASLSYSGTILERDATEILGGITYTDIIKMRLNAVEIVNSQTTNIEAEYWFAKDIGLIWESVTSSTDNVTKTRYLTSAELN